MLIHFSLMRESMLQSSSIIKQIWFSYKASLQKTTYTAQFSLLHTAKVAWRNSVICQRHQSRAGFLTTDQRICGSTISALIKMLHGDPTPQFCSGHSKKCLVLLRFLSVLVQILWVSCSWLYAFLSNEFLMRKHGQWEGEPFNTPFTFTNWFLHSLFLSKYSISTKIYHNNRSSFRSY